MQNVKELFFIIGGVLGIGLLAIVLGAGGLFAAFSHVETHGRHRRLTCYAAQEKIYDGESAGGVVRDGATWTFIDAVTENEMIVSGACVVREIP